MIDRIFWLIFMVLGIISLVKGDTEDAINLFLLGSVCNNSADINDIKKEIKRGK